MVVNFRARGISQGARKLARTSMLIKKIILEHVWKCDVIVIQNIFLLENIL